MTITTAQLLTDRASAGATYVTALASLKTAWVALRSYDIAMTAKKAALGPLAGTHTFGQASTWNPDALRHPAYALTPEYMADWEAAAQTAAVSLVATLA